MTNPKHSRRTRTRRKFVELWNSYWRSVTSKQKPRMFRFESLEERRVLATLYAVNSSNQLLTFDSDTPGTIATSIGITGLDANTTVQGIDFRPATGQLYALGIVDNGQTQTGRLYQLNTANAVATPVGPALSNPLNGALYWEIDFDPTADSIRVVNSSNANLRLNPNDGSLLATDTTLTASSTFDMRGIAYDRNEGASLTTLYGYEYVNDTLATIGGNNGSPSPNGGVINRLPNGSGVRAFGPLPFDIGSGSTVGFLATRVNSPSGNSSLVSMNLSTGAATNLGRIGDGSMVITGLAVPLQSLTVVGTAGADTLVINATGPNSGTYSLNGGPAVPFSNLNRFTFNGGTGNDTLTINNPAGGLFAPSGGIDYNGGGQAGDTLEMLGGVGGAQSYFVGTTTPPIGAGPGNNTDGLIRFTGATPVDIRFTGLAPIIDTVLASSLTVVSTDAANNISVTNGSASRLLVNVDAFESIEFTNKSQFIINAGDGVAGGDAADNVLLNFSNLPPGLASMTINADGGADVINVQATSGVPVAINGGDGLDIINVGNTGSLGTPGLLTPVAGPVSVNGGVDGASLTVDGTGSAVAADYAITATTVARTSPAGFGGVSYSNLSSLLLTVGAGANVINVNGTAPTVVTNIATGAGNDSIVFANGVSLNGGLVNGGADTDTLDYSAYTTGVSANLGLTVSGLAATLAGDQEVPPTPATASGTATITNYNLVTKTFDISVTVNDLNPASVTGFHIHRGAFGVNGPVIVDFSTGPLVPAGTGFTFNAVGVSLNAANMQDEAALLSGLTYLNIHTAAFPAGIIRGQLFPNGNVALSSGIATGTAGVFGIENAIGGSGADGLVGSTAGNSLQGGAGNDVLLGGPGNDTMLGGNDNDNLVWSNGDGTDVIDGNLGTDIISVNGAVAAGDIFTVTGAGSRVAFARTNLGPFGLDIGTTERLILNGVGGDDSITSSDMSGVADLTTLDLNGQVGNDTFNAAFTTPAGLTVNIKGGPHGAGDTLVVDAGGGPLTDTGSQLSKPGSNPINYIQVENLTVNNIGDLVITGSGANDNLVVNATSANSGTYQLNGGPVIAFTGMTKLTFNSAAGSDGLTINNPAVGLFAPVGGIDYNGGGQAGDSLNLLGGGAADLVQTYSVGTTTPPIGAGPGNSGDGLVRFTGSSNVDIRFTGLAPIVDTVLAASLTVISTDGANNISVTNGVAPRLIVAVDAYEPIEFNNKGQLIINAGDGVAGGDSADNVLLNFSNLPAGLASITINADEGADAVSLQASSNVPVTLNGGDGLDIINVGNNGTLGTPGLLTPVAGPVIVNGGAGGADLTVDGTGAAVAENYGITATTVTRTSPAGFGGVTYSNLTSLLLATGAGPNIVTVSSTSVPTTADANGGTDTLILNPPNSISVYEQAGAYGFDLGFPGALTALDFENINLQPGNGVLNVVGDQGQGTSVGAGVNTADVVAVIGTAQNAGGLRLSNIAVPQSVQFTGVTNLNINTFDLDDDVTLDPFATTTQSWNVVVNVNTGSGDDDIIYGNANVLPGLDPTANGSAAGVSENVTVTPTIVIGAGEIAVPGVVTIHYQDTEDLSFLLNDGTAGDTDRLTIRGLDSNLPDVFTIRPDAAGNDAEPVVDIDTNAVQLLQIENIATVAPGGAQFFVTNINFDGLAGADTFNVLPSASGTVLNIDGGSPTFNPLLADRIVIDAPANPANQVSIQAGATSDSGSIIANLGAPRAPINFSRVEGITVNNSGAAGVVGNNGNNQITLAGTGASALTATVDGGPTLQFNAVTSLQINALAGNDDVALTVGPLAITSISVSGGDPTASDKLVIVGTPGVDTVVFAPASASSGSLTGLASPVNFTTTEHVVYDGNDNAAIDNLTINGPITNNTFNYDASLLMGSFSSFLSPEFVSLRSARITINGGPSMDQVNLFGSAGADNVASAGNAISIITPGSLAIITLGAGIDSVAVSTLAGNDSVNFTGLPAPTTTTILGGDGDDTLVGSLQADLIYGGDGNDVIIGGAGIDVAYGEAGNDSFGDPAVADPAANDAGNDQFYGGDGSDTLTWDPGDGSDLFEGGAGTDVIVFNGSAGAEVFTFNAVGARLELLRSVGLIDMDLAEVEQVNLNALGGADRTTINDLSSTAVRVVNVSLGLDAATDAVIVQGRSVDDNLTVTRSGATSLAIAGLPYNVVVDTGEPTDTLNISANAGNDQVTAAPGAEAVMAITLGGGLGNDILTGNVLNLFGNEGDDLLVGGAGNQTFDGAEGDDTFIGNGGADNVGGGGANSIGDTILLPGTVGADTFNLSLTATGQLIATVGGVTTTYSDFIGGPIANSGIEQILVSGSAGNDALTVDSTNGAVAIPVNYDGGNNADLLALTGGTATSNTYAVGPTITEGTSTIVIGGVTQVVRFNALEPVIDLVAGPLVVMATDADNAINYTQGGVATNALVSIDGFETIEFSNKTILTIEGLAGNDTINLNNSNTPTGLTDIIINGGDPTASDTVIVNGTAGVDTINFSPTGIQSGTVAVNALPVASLNQVEHVTIVGRGGNDDLTVTTPLGIHLLTLTPAGTNGAEGNITIADFGDTPLLSMNYREFDANSRLTLADASGTRVDQLHVRGTNRDDRFTIQTNGNVQVLDSASDEFITLLALTPGVRRLRAQGLDGVDQFNISGSHPFILGVAIEGGDPSASDSVNFTGSGANPITINAATNSIGESGFQPVSLSGIEQLNVTASNDLNVIATGGNDTVTYQPTGVASGRITQLLSNTTINLASVTTLTVNGNGGADSFTVQGTTGNDSFTTISDTSIVVAGLLGATLTNFGAGDSIRVDGGAGNDSFTVSGGSLAAVTIIGGDPIQFTDALVVNAAAGLPVSYRVGPQNDEGAIQVGANSPISFDQIESLSINGGGNNAVAVQATNADNDITVVGNGANSFTVSIDGGPAVQFNAVNDLVIDALAGDDDISVTTGPLAINSITINGGDPTAGSDTVVVTGTLGADNVTVDQLAIDGARIQGLGPNILLTTVEHLYYSGLAGNDTLSVSATAGSDTITVDQGPASDAGKVSVNSLLSVNYQTLGSGGSLVLLDLGGANDRLVINGSTGDDNYAVLILPGVISYQSDVASVLGGTNHVPISIPTAGNLIEGLVLNSQDGNDNFVINSAALFSLGIAINAGNSSAGADRVSVNGTAGSDAIGLTLGISNDTVSGVVLGNIQLSSVESLSLSTGAGDDTFTVNGLGGDSALGSVRYFSGSDPNDSFTVNATTGNDDLVVTPVNATLATVSANGRGPLVEATLNAAVTSVFTVNGGVGSDNVTVLGNAANNTISVVKAANTTVDVTGGKTITIPSTLTEAVIVDGANGNDTFNISGTAANGQSLQINGGNPTSNAGAVSDVLNVTLATLGTTAAVPGATPDAGVITNPDGAINYSGIEFFNVTGAAGANTFNIQGTHDNDTIALQFLGGANRVWINDRAVYTFANYATVNMNGLFGDDKINVLPVGLVGVTTINVAGGDPTASDELVVSGTTGNDVFNYTTSNTVGSGSVAITGSATVNFTTTEALVIDGLGGTDSLTVTTPAGVGHRTTVTPGANADSGTIVSQAFGTGTGSVPLTYAHIGATASVTLVGQGDIVEFNGSVNSDTFNITGTTIQVINATAGFVTNLFTLTNVFSVEARGLNGNDRFNVAGTLAALAGGLVIDGGNPSTSDVVNLTGAIGAVSVALADPIVATDTLISGYGALVSLIGIEIANVNAAGQALSVVGTGGNDNVTITPAVGGNGTVVAGSANPLINYSGAQANTLNVDLVGGINQLTVVATSLSDIVTVLGNTSVDTGVFGGIVNFAATVPNAISVLGLQGDDRFNVTPGASPIFIDGGDPIGVLSGDVLSVNNAVAYYAGPESDEGGVGTNAANVSFDHIESLIVAPIVGCPFLIVGTDASDQITVIARDATTHAGANGVQDFTVSLNSAPQIFLLDVADLFIDAKAGNDDIVIVANAPNDADWDVNVRVAGGTPSIGGPAQSDRLVVQTPNLLGGFDNVVFNATGAETGNLVLDSNANGVYDAAGTDSLITFDSFVFNCPPANFTYASSLGGVELIQLDGQGAPAIDDNLTINGTTSNDTTVVSPAGAGSGYFVSDASPRFEFKSFDFLAVTPGANGFDSVTINGTAGNDVITSTATDITLAGNIVSLAQGIDALSIVTMEGDDNLDLDLQLTSLRKTIDLGIGNDVANMTGLIIDPADPTIYGSDGDDIIIGSPNPDFIFGGTGNDILIGAGGIDQIYGEAGNDTFGNPSPIANGIADDAGNDLFNGGEGSDTFVWEPGDGSDTIEGGAGDADVLLFFGGANAEVFNVFAKLSDPTRAILFRNTGNITMDMAGVDQINVTGNAGINSYVIGRANNGDSGNVVAPTAPFTDPTASLSDLSTTEVKVVNIIDSAVSADTIYVDGRSGDDSLVVNVDGAASNTVRVTGLPYEVRVTGTTTADRLTIRGNAGNDTLRVLNTTGPTVDSLIAVTLAGSIGNDTLIGSDILIGGIGDDYLEGGALADQLFGNEGEDTMVGGAGNDTFDGGDGFDSILVRGTSAADAIDINQTADVTLLETVNLVTETDTLVLQAGVRTVERVKVQAGDGNDTIRVQWADTLGTDANVNSLRVEVDGGAGTTADRLGVVDLGTGDLILIQNGTTNDSGSMSIGPGNAEPLIVTYTSIETAQPIVGNGGDVVVFKHDPFEFNDFRTNATYLGANSAINVDPVINPGVDPIFGFPGDEDWYRVVAETTGVLDFQVYFRQLANVASGRPGLPNAGNLDIAVTDVAGNVVAGFGTNDNTNDERIRIPAIAGQTYYLRVFANGAAINTYDITVDNYAAPVPRDIELLDNPVGDPPPANSDTGRSQFDNVTRDNTPTLVFRLDDGVLLNDLPGNAAAGNPPDEVITIPFQAAAGIAGFRIAIFDEGSSPAPGTQVGTAPQTPLGFATQVAPGVYQFTTPALSDGSHFLTARVQMVDPANPQQTGFGDRSVALEVVVDTVTPPVFFGTAASATDGLHKDSDSGIATVLGSYVDRITNDTTPTMYGVAEANTIVKLFVDRTANGFTADDILLGQTVTPPLDGSNQGSGQWEITPTTGLNSPDLVAALGKDGLRTLFVTAEDLAGNVSAQQTLNILIDTTPPIVSAVNYANGQSVFGTKPTASPTPRVDSIFITYQGGPVGAGGLEIPAVDPGLALDIRNYKLVGDNSGTILITGSALVSSSATQVVVRLDFSKPLPDDRFSLTISDEISDAANNALDGNSQAASPGNAGSVLPSGNGIAGGSFVGRFTVDSRPELGAVSEGLIYADINGNFVWDVVGKDDDQTNRDLTFQLGRTTDRVFAGNFARVGTIASGYDKLGAYGKVGALYTFALDTNDDGVADYTTPMPGAYQVNGIPIAGNFSNAKSGDEIGLFDGSFWYLDTNGNNAIDVGERIASNFNGEPVVGDFNGDGADDLATFTPSTNTFRFDTNRDGSVDVVWNVTDQVGRFIGLTGFTTLPIAGDMNLDGIDDLGLWVKGRSGVLPRNMAETFMWLSDNANANPSLVFNSYSPDPLGNDLYLQFGDEMALPVFGNFDPPTGGGGTGTIDVNPLHRTNSPLDVNGDGKVSPIDALLVIDLLNKNLDLPYNDPLAILEIARVTRLTLRPIVASARWMLCL